MTLVTNHMNEYITIIVQKLTVWYEEHMNQYEWENEKERVIEDLVSRLSQTQLSELLFFYSINDIIKESTKRYGKPFFLIYNKNKLNTYVQFSHHEFTELVVQQLLWTELHKQPCIQDITIHF